MSSLTYHIYTKIYNKLDWLLAVETVLIIRSTQEYLQNELLNDQLEEVELAL